MNFKVCNSKHAARNKATQGEVSLENWHPFVRELWGPPRERRLLSELYFNVGLRPAL